MRTKLVDGIRRELTQEESDTLDAQQAAHATNNTPEKKRDRLIEETKARMDADPILAVLVKNSGLTRNQFLQALNDEIA